MKIKLIRFKNGEDHTVGVMLIDGEFECYTLEDEHRTVKVMGETRIPEGIYNIGFRLEGGFHQRYGAKYGAWHKGMLEVKDVPNFKYVLIHKGNHDDETAGCILVGEGNVRGDNWVSGSSAAYGRLYPKVRNALEKNEKVILEIVDATK